eukprot:CAMPEP_0204597526 /NCGR_PEP_ID=MMETSP0661-20131031/53856_1 /ASSEMBLY_ACC=CAM_ASM_000606 /TAXON_ID=109239 /ORGANISM="Alexandrium margalefi, Strain AMGDE01CS-322" /LENGTH=69 /DNA_ID=CAMNT_0051608223 /DNA_START=14 /DNA_END=219 /DNA_ORIENTATION=-
MARAAGRSHGDLLGGQEQRSPLLAWRSPACPLRACPRARTHPDPVFGPRAAGSLAPAGSKTPPVMQALA